jgi:glyoxylase-like metal-dependent hydrolase (beta-lactamase superfamily II)
LRLAAASDGLFREDGGGMFGVVPKVLWEKVKTPDALNRVPVATNCLLVRGPDFNLLIESGLGDKLGEKEHRIFAIERTQGLMAAVVTAGLHPEEITHVILSHLHFDHCGSVVRHGDGRLVPAFPKARHVVQAKEIGAWRNPDARSRPAYLVDNFAPLLESGLVDAVDGDAEVLPGVRVERTGGHTAGHQVVHLESQGERALFVGDLIPFRAMLKQNWVSGLDLFPLESMEVKTRLLAEVARRRALVWLYHEHVRPVGYLTADARDLEAPESHGH